MNKIIVITAIFLTLTLTTANTQNPYYNNGITVKSLFMDYQSQNGGSLTDFKSYHHGFEIGYMENLQRNINLVVPVKVGVVTSHNNPVNDLDNCLHKTVYGIDAILQYQWYRPESQITPYIMGGLGGVSEVEGNFNMQAPLGAGLFFKIADNAYINWQSEYRLAFSEDRNNLHHALGFVYLMNKRGKSDLMDKMKEKKMLKGDSDGDGIPDDLDLCPQSVGPRELNGCPDGDMDGIADYKDACPTTPGLKAFNGCPDTDGDGISDKDDECPNMAGVLSNNGCPDNDRDNDGIPDNLDSCPDIAGTPANNGCPSTAKPVNPQPTRPTVQDRDGDGITDAQDRCPDAWGPASSFGCPDSDNDGIPDYDDKCPNAPGISVYNGCPDSDGDGIDDSRDKCPGTYGTVANGGCPDIAKEDREVLELAMRAVQFDTGRATLKSESNRILNQIADIMRRYPGFALTIEGHTDNTGSAGANQALSQRRAKACYDYLATRGISTANMKFVGHGEAKPISDNNTLRGRSLNRRVEFNLSPR